MISHIPMDCSLPGSLCAWNFPDKNTEVGCHVLLQGIFSTQGWNWGLPHCRQILYLLSHITYLAVRGSSLEDSESWPEEKNTSQLQEVWKERERILSGLEQAEVVLLGPGIPARGVCTLTGAQRPCSRAWGDMVLLTH